MISKKKALEMIDVIADMFQMQNASSNMIMLSN